MFQWQSEKQQKSPLGYWSLGFILNAAGNSMEPTGPKKLERKEKGNFYHTASYGRLKQQPAKCKANKPSQREGERDFVGPNCRRVFNRRNKISFANEKIMAKLFFLKHFQ